MKYEYYSKKSRNTLVDRLLNTACVVAAVALGVLAFQEFRAGEVWPASAFSLGCIASITGAVAPK